MFQTAFGSRALAVRSLSLGFLILKNFAGSLTGGSFVEYLCGMGIASAFDEVGE